MTRGILTGLLIVASVSGDALAGGPTAPPPKKAPGAAQNAAAQDLNLQRSITMKTMGGRQFWGDVEFFHDWRIQKNVFTGHCRLLDGNDVRHTWGSREECQKALEVQKRARKLPPMGGKAVVLIHGIIRSSKSFGPMRASLEQAGYKVFGFDYPSTQVPIPEAAEYLHECLQSLKGVEEINFVVHSMGGLVVRSYLSTHEDDRIRRMVMLGVPNKGAELADLLRQNFFFRAIYGPAGQQLVTDGQGLIARLPIPEFEFAVIAGARGDARGFNPLLAGDDDGTVRVDSTRLEGAADFNTVNCLHSLMMRDPNAIDQCLRFLRDGRLRADGPCQAIPRPKAAPAETQAALP